VLTRELVLGLVAIAITLGLAFTARTLHPTATAVGVSDAFVAARDREVRSALALYRREHGEYPRKLQQLASGGWISPRRLGDQKQMRYEPSPDLRDYTFEIAALP
jgi:hypothetical protein